MHPSTAAILRFFAYSHLPPHLAAVSAPFCRLAHAMAGDDDHAEGVTVGGPLDGPELTVAIRKLLEAKDAAVRAAIR